MNSHSKIKTGSTPNNKTITEIKKRKQKSAVKSEPKEVKKRKAPMKRKNTVVRAKNKNIKKKKLTQASRFQQSPKEKKIEIVTET